MLNTKTLILLILFSNYQIAFATSELRIELYKEIFNIHGGSFDKFVYSNSKKTPSINYLIEFSTTPDNYYNEVTDFTLIDLQTNSLFALSYFLYDPNSEKYNKTVMDFYNEQFEKIETMPPALQLVLLNALYNTFSPYGIDKLSSLLASENLELKKKAILILSALEHENDLDSYDNNKFSDHQDHHHDIIGKLNSNIATSTTTPVINNSKKYKHNFDFQKNKKDWSKSLYLLRYRVNKLSDSQINLNTKLRLEKKLEKHANKNKLAQNKTKTITKIDPKLALDLKKKRSAKIKEKKKKIVRKISNIEEEKSTNYFYLILILVIAIMIFATFIIMRKKE